MKIYQENLNGKQYSMLEKIFSVKRLWISDFSELLKFIEKIG